MTTSNARPETAPALTSERREAAIELLERDIETLCAFRDQYRAHLPGGVWHESRAWYAERVTAARAAIAFLRQTADLQPGTPGTCPRCDGEISVDEYDGDGETAYEIATCDDCGARVTSIGMLYRIETRPAEEATP